MQTLLFQLEPEYDFVKHLADVDSYEKEAAILECEMNYDDAPVQWLKDDKVFVALLLSNKFQIHCNLIITRSFIAGIQL